MCINLDISDILLAEKTLNKMAGSADHYLVIFPDIPGRPFDYFFARGD